MAQLLCERHGFHRVSLGSIARLHCLLRGLEPTRAAMQAAGDEIRGGDPARLARLAMQMAPGEAEDVVIEGVRLRAEAEALREAGYVGIAIHAPLNVRLERLQVRDGSVVVPAHHTETEADLLPVDFHLLNDGRPYPWWRRREARVRTETLARRVAHTLRRLRQREAI